jgi:hypothetical protein
MHDVLTPCHVRLLGCLLANGTALDVLSPIDDGKHLFALEDLFLQQLCWLLGVSVLKQEKKESYHCLITCHFHV